MHRTLSISGYDLRGRVQSQLKPLILATKGKGSLMKHLMALGGLKTASLLRNSSSCGHSDIRYMTQRLPCTCCGEGVNHTHIVHGR